MFFRFTFVCLTSMFLAAPLVADEKEPPIKKDVNQLIRWFRSKDPAKRRSAAYEIGLMGKKGKGAVIDLWYALGDKDASVRAEVIVALARVEGQSPKLIKTMIRMMDSPWVKDRYGALDAARHLTPEAYPLLPHLFRLARGEDWDIGVHALVALDYIHNRKKLGKIALQQMLKDGSFDALIVLMHSFSEIMYEIPEYHKSQIRRIRRYARRPYRPLDAKALDQLAKHGIAAVPYLEEALKSPNPILRKRAIQLLAKQRREALSRLPSTLADPDRTVRDTAYLALKKLVAQDRKDLHHLFETSDPKTRALTLRALEDMGVSVVPLVGGMMVNVERDVRLEAVEVLQHSGNPAIPHLLKGLADEDFVVRILSAKALAKIGKSALPAVIRSLKSKNRTTRKGAITTLAVMGSTARPALPHLQRLDTRNDVELRVAVEEAVRRIGRSRK